MGTWKFILESILLGTVQGLTEFLPVSSSGHLTLLQRLLGFETEGGTLTFLNVMLHLGTLMPVFWLFRKEILALSKKPRDLLMLLVATVPAGIVGVLFHHEIDSFFSGGQALLPLAGCFLVTAGLLLICEGLAARGEKRPLGWKEAGAMGIMQAVALFPGISRSGSTVFAGTLFGAKRGDVARFSFLMSIPVVLGSALVEGKEFLSGEVAFAFGSVEIVGVLLGVAAAAVSGFFAVKLMKRVIERANYRWFSLYLAVLSLFCLHLNAIGL